jgi:hypothetical protein
MLVELEKAATAAKGTMGDGLNESVRPTPIRHQTCPPRAAACRAITRPLTRVPRKTLLGPINNKMQLARVSELVEDAKASGARVVAGGSVFTPAGIKEGGYFYEPTILADVQEGVRIVDEEQFGPVMPVIKVPLPPPSPHVFRPAVHW